LSSESATSKLAPSTAIDHRRASHAREQVREQLMREHPTAMLGQERTHAARRHQMPDQSRHVQQRPVGALYTPHPEFPSTSVQTGT
jgi:hypothetical protein